MLADWYLVHLSRNKKVHLIKPLAPREMSVHVVIKQDPEFDLSFEIEEPQTTETETEIYSPLISTSPSKNSYLTTDDNSHNQSFSSFSLADPFAITNSNRQLSHDQINSYSLPIGVGIDTDANSPNSFREHNNKSTPSSSFYYTHYPNNDNTGTGTENLDFDPLETSIKCELVEFETDSDHKGGAKDLRENQHEFKCMFNKEQERHYSGSCAGELNSESKHFNFELIKNEIESSNSDFSSEAESKSSDTVLVLSKSKQNHTLTKNSSKLKPKSQKNPNQSVGRNLCQNRKLSSSIIVEPCGKKIKGDNKVDQGRIKCACPLCGKLFPCNSALRSHIETHKSKEEQVRPYLCETCGQSFRLSYNYVNHLKTHSDERPFKCPQPNCQQTFKIKSVLRNHLKVTHSDSRPFLCQVPDCGKTFKDKKYLAAHAQVFHSDERPYGCKVEGCQAAFATPGQLNYHVKGKHSEDNEALPKFPCDSCAKIFTLKWQLKRHALAHTEDRPFKCSEEGCTSAYKRKHKLVEHQKRDHPENIILIP